MSTPQKKIDITPTSESTNRSEPSEAVARLPLHDQIIARLRDLIIEGDLEPGVRVSERELCERFKVSRTPLREAFKVLAWEGLLTLSPNRGATVTDVSLADVDEVFPVMGALEALSGELACRHITDNELHTIRKQHETMVDHFQRGELPEYFRMNQAIHEAILTAARNPTLTRAYQGLSDRVRRMRYIANLSKVRWRQTVSEHEQMLTALERRDGEVLAQILKQHLKNKLDTVKSYLTKGER